MLRWLLARQLISRQIVKVPPLCTDSTSLSMLASSTLLSCRALSTVCVYKSTKKGLIQAKESDKGSSSWRHFVVLLVTLDTIGLKLILKDHNIYYFFFKIKEITYENPGPSHYGWFLLWDPTKRKGHWALHVYSKGIPRFTLLMWGHKIKTAEAKTA